MIRFSLNVSHALGSFYFLRNIPALRILLYLLIMWTSLNCGASIAIFEMLQKTSKSGDDNSLLTLFSLETLTKSIAISNLSNIGNSVIETGFLVGTAFDNNSVSSVEVSLDGGPFLPATGTTNWVYQLPNGANTWKMGSLHSINVRSKNPTGNVSASVSISARQGKNKDINGDGYPDLAVGTPSASSNTGQVFLFYSSGSGGILTSNLAAANASISGTANSTFGNFVDLGDVNGDGYADLAAGATAYSANTGQVYIFHSTGITGISASSVGNANATITGIAGSQLGYALALGDINGDGYADLATGAYMYSNHAGQAYVFHSTGSAGITASSYSGASTTIIGPGTSNFAASLALGDVNGDGYADLALGGNYYNTSRGNIWIFHSAGSGGITASSYSSANTNIPGETIYNDFGLPLAFGDVNGDGYADLASGANRYNNTFTGKVYVFQSTGINGITVSAAGSATTMITGQTSGDTFGGNLTFGDINGDGYADLAAGAANYASATGRAYIFPSTGSAGLSAVASVTINGEGTGNSFASALAFSDFNGDGYSDLAAGASTYSSTLGRTYVFLSSGKTGTVASLASAANAIITGATNSNFGSSVANGNEDSIWNNYLKMVTRTGIFKTEDTSIFLISSRTEELAIRDFTYLRKPTQSNPF
ncbi:FG-GAP repeat protein [Leptospira broomii serovar Hurstbridge str. 5399]|uniref:FG-GAP repeat protein n=1 Tax=Leptospira broomii serovar Hurstbridge str. 5399 TaxID=1049789 RepID=T0FGU4_9LEPT|nr:FG-GAP-like repeat-containing protein [Leptospira broomii]EQA47146.1 FG-GAP repeat protein [Leptospira broomii serovar Hurstbridge str. 5399]